MREEDIAYSIRNSSNLYEDLRGIKSLNIKPVLTMPDIKFLAIHKSDNSVTMVIAFKITTRENNWFWLVPTENQIRVLSNFGYRFYKKINKRNKEVRK